MKPTRDAMAQTLAARWWWQAARRDDARLARRWYRKHVVDGVYPLDEGAGLDDFFSFLHELGVGDWLGEVQGPAVQRERVPCVQDLRLYSLQPLLGIERRHALPTLRFRAEARRRLVGVKAPQVRHGVCPRGAAPRPGPRTTGPLCPDTWADNLVKRHLRALEAGCNGVIRALAKAGGWAPQGTGSVEATALETTAQDDGGGHVTRPRKITDTRGHEPAIAVTVDGWTLSVLSAAGAKMPLAGQVVPIQAHEVLSRRARVTPARTHLAGHARLHTVVVEQGFWAGADLWWLAPRGNTFVVPAKDQMAGTADARAPAVAGEGLPVGRRGHPVRHGQGRAARPERLEPAVVGITGLTTWDHEGRPEHGRQANRRDLRPHASNAVVVRQGRGRDDGPGGNPGFLPNAAVAKPLQPLDADADRRLIEHGSLKESQQPGRVQPPPQKTAPAVRVHGIVTRLMCALATAYRRRGEQAETGREPVGWQRWRRQLLEQTRADVSVFAEGGSGIVHRAASSLLMGGTIKARPLGIGTRLQSLAPYGLTTPG